MGDVKNVTEEAIILQYSHTVPMNQLTSGRDQSFNYFISPKYFQIWLLDEVHIHQFVLKVPVSAAHWIFQSEVATLIEVLNHTISVILWTLSYICFHVLFIYLLFSTSCPVDIASVTLFVRHLTKIAYPVGMHYIM